MAYQPMLSALAEAIAEWFPDLGGRSLAVSEVEPFTDKSNVPTLPIAVVALVNEVNENAATTGGSTRITLVDDVLVQFIYDPSKYQREDGVDTPFFAFYDYEPLRDTLIRNLRNWRTPRGGSINYVSLDVDTDEFAVYIVVRLRVSTLWADPLVCDPPETCTPEAAGPKVRILGRLYPPVSEKCDDFELCPKPEPSCYLDRDDT